MITVRPFRALRPVPEKASQVAAPPYDVLDSEEARKKAAGNPISFLHVSKPEIDMPPDTDIYKEAVYAKGMENLQRFIKQGVFILDESPCFYIYHLKMGNHEQTGLMAVTSTEEYEQNRIKKHEHTKPDKETDRMRHILETRAHCGPVLLMYKAQKDIDALIAEGIQKSRPVYDIVGDYEIRHILYRIQDPGWISSMENAFKKINALYVADGHHRSAAAARAAKQLRSQNADHRGTEPYNFFLSVIFPDNQMKILDYNRVIQDLNRLSRDEFIKKISKKFSVTVHKPAKKNPESGCHPQEEHTFGMYLEGQWFLLKAKPEVTRSDDPVERLDVSILQNHLLSPVLGIGDPRTDKRIHFVGGIRGLGELERLVNSGEYRVAFSMFPTGIGQIMDVADAGKVMPPKSTWFEPKLRSGLVIHPLD
jgi:uncharacterized protein (DUF1015 family)